MREGQTNNKIIITLFNSVPILQAINLTVIE